MNAPPQYQLNLLASTSGCEKIYSIFHFCRRVICAVRLSEEGCSPEARALDAAMRFVVIGGT